MGEASSLSWAPVAAYYPSKTLMKKGSAFRNIGKEKDLSPLFLRSVTQKTGVLSWFLFCHGNGSESCWGSNRL